PQAADRDGNKTPRGDSAAATLLKLDHTAGAAALAKSDHRISYGLPLDGEGDCRVELHEQQLLYPGCDGIERVDDACGCVEPGNPAILLLEPVVVHVHRRSALIANRQR